MSGVSMRKHEWMIALLFVAVAAMAADPKREDLLKDPRYVEAAPEYVTVAGDALKDQIKVFSRRNYAVFGFNDPSVTILVPHNDNSIYATFDFSKPAVVDKRGKAVAYEIEHGIYDFGTSTNEIRLQRPGGKPGLEYAKASGTIAVKYPLAVKTTRVKKAKPVENIRFDGPFVIITGDLELPEAATFSKIQPLRAYDAKGRQLERDTWQSTSFEDDKTTHTIAFHGNVAELQIDRVDRWANVNVTYDMPPTPPLAASMAGTAQTMVTETPGAVVKISVQP